MAEKKYFMVIKKEDVEKLGCENHGFAFGTIYTEEGLCVKSRIHGMKEGAPIKEIVAGFKEKGYVVFEMVS